jgi:hypothetical protein
MLAYNLTRVMNIMGSQPERPQMIAVGLELLLPRPAAGTP